MIFAALLESGTGAVHAINERVATAWTARRGDVLGPIPRAGLSLAVLLGSMVVAGRFGLITLIASDYRALAYAIIAIYVLPLMTIGRTD